MADPVVEPKVEEPKVEEPKVEPTKEPEPSKEPEPAKEPEPKAKEPEPEPPKEEPKEVEYKLPEGYQDESIVKFAKDAGLSQEQLDQVLNYGNLKNQEYQQAFQAKQEADVAALKEEWGDKFKENVTAANHLISYFDNEEKELANFLKTSGLGNSPIMIKFFTKAAVALQEDGWLKSESAPTKQAKKSTAAILYPTMSKEEGD